MSNSAYDQKFKVPYNFPVEFTTDVFDPGNPILASILQNAHVDGPVGRVVAWFDDGVLAAQPHLEEQLKTYFEECLSEYQLSKVSVYPGGEAVKEGWTHVHEMLNELREARLCRQSYLLAIGGGAFLDAAGFAAALVHRGVRLIRLPATVLSQDDSGVGVKNGINLHGNKNFLGTFAPPFAVINDFNFLTSLSLEVKLDGLAEAFKVAIIKDLDFFTFLEDKMDYLKAGQPEALNEAVQRCAILHLQHIGGGGDPFEMGSARPLDFGHWAAHRLECISDYMIRHGQAVAIGIALDSWYAGQKGLLTEEEVERIISALSEMGLPIYHPLLSAIDHDGNYLVLDGIEQFREHLGGSLHVTLPKGIGERVEVTEIDQITMIDGIQYLAERTGS